MQFIACLSFNRLSDDLSLILCNHTSNNNKNGKKIFRHYKSTENMTGREELRVSLNEREREKIAKKPNVGRSKKARKSSEMQSIQNTMMVIFVQCDA